MEEIKRSFKRVKEDIFFLGNEVENLKQQLQDINFLISKLQNTLNNLELQNLELNFKLREIKDKEIPTQIKEKQTDKVKISTDNKLYEALKTQILGFSTGNCGVPTDRQTDQQTDKSVKTPTYEQIKQEFEVPKLQQYNKNVVVKKVIQDKEDEFDKAIRILDSLDNIKKDIRRKFKGLTEQEFNVFSTLYMLEDKGLLVDYKILAENLSLTESSIRDYVGKLINKGIPITKEKINNKQIILHISSDLKQITSLETIIKLREI